MADFARAELLRELREAKHLSQEAVAQELGVTTKTVGSWERGKGIHWQNAKRVAAFYGVEPERVVSREDGDGPDLLAQFDTPSLEERFDEVNRKLDEILKRLPEPATTEELGDTEDALDEAEAELERLDEDEDASDQAAGQ